MQIIAANSDYKQDRGGFVTFDTVEGVCVSQHNQPIAHVCGTLGKNKNLQMRKDF